MKIATYVYPGWHPVAERDAAFYPGFTEWDLVERCAARFPGHAQPRLPAWGRYDDRDPEAVALRVRAACDHGVDALVYGFFWCRGKQVFEEALDRGFLGARLGVPFAVMWANRMPRRVLPVRRADLPVIEAERLVSSDVDDFVHLITTLATRYFAHPDYLRIDGRPCFSIFDTTFFLRELGLAAAAEAIARARAWLRAEGFGGLYLTAIDPSAEVAPHLAALGFDRVTHYVLLPYWKGAPRQDYAEVAARRAGEWAGYARASGLPYWPSVAPGWDASPRAADFGAERPRKYPWSPVVVGEHPDEFRRALARAVGFVAGDPEPLVMVASLNEWSEGHYLEPDQRFGMQWLEAVRAAR